MSKPSDYMDILNRQAAVALWSPEEMSVGDVAAMLYPNAVYDHALPQEWVDLIRDDTGFDPVGHVVWHVDGYPLPLTKEAVDELLAADDLPWFLKPQAE